MNSKYDLTNDAMQIIVWAGDARQLIMTALEKIAQHQFSKTQSLLDEAESLLNNAHKIQSRYMSLEASGTHIPYSVLFNHAQDSLMITMSELNIAKKMSIIMKSEVKNHE